MKYRVKGAALQVYFSQVFAEVAATKAEALTIKFSLGKSIAEKRPRQNVFSYSYFGILFAAAKNAVIRCLISYIYTLGFSAIATIFGHYTVFHYYSNLRMATVYLVFLKSVTES